MSDSAVGAGTTAKLGKIEGELKVGRGARIIPESGRRVVVTEGAYFEGPATLDCDFECKSMRVEGRGWGPGGDFVIRGALTIHGSADINASVRADGEVVSQDLDIAGHLQSGSVTSKGLRVGGHLTTRGSLRAEMVDVGGHMSITDDVDIAGLRVGGHAQIGGGKISGEIKVRGHFTTKKPLTYGQIQVYGHLRLPAGSTGEQIVALGKVELDGDTTCKVIEINGVGKVRGNCKADNLKVNGKFETTGGLRVSDKLEVNGSAETKKELECGRLFVGGRLTADSIVATGQADVAGEIWTEHGLKAKAVRIGTGSRINGPIVGETVEVGTGIDLGGFWAHATNLRSIGRMTRVDDVWGREVDINRYSQAKRVYADVVRMKSGSIADEVNYTKDVDVPDHTHVGKPPKKVERLPEPPI